MRSRSMLVAGLFTGVIAALSVFAAAEPVHADDPTRTMRDVMWAWGNPEMAQPGPHTVATFAEAGCAERARLLGVSNIVMAGKGLPNDDAKADALTKEVAGFKRLVWEITPDGTGLGPPFVYKDRIAQIRKLVDKYPQVEGVLLDDMSTGKMDRGFKPEHIRHIRQQLADKHPAVKIWGVVYSMSLARPMMDECLKEVDVITLCVWKAQDVVRLEEYVAHCERVAPKKPIVLGLYLWDYDGNRPMPLDLLKQQCETALRLVHAGRIAGMVFVTINNDATAVGWAADWIKRVGDQKLGAPPAAPKAAAEPYPRKIPGALSWIAGRDGSILMCVGRRIARSTDGGDTWQDIGKVSDGTPRGYFSRLPDGGLLLVVSTREDGSEVAWVRSDDDGQTWSKPTPILTLKKHWCAWGPIYAVQDGRWGYCPYFEEVNAKGELVRSYSLLVWSKDKGKTWSEPIVFPKAADGNRGLSEMAIAQCGPRHYFAAIRADDTVGSWDGFYWSESTDGLTWSAPKSFGERGRMPVIYKMKNGWVLAYRQYDAEKGVQHSTIRFSRDGRKWSSPRWIEIGADTMPQLVDLGGKIIAFNTLYPDRDMVTRNTLVLPENQD